MGYYTRHEMELVPYGEELNKNDAINIARDLNEISGYTWHAYDNGIEVDDEMKWYDHDKDMIKLSLMYPDILFKLEGEGEEQGDHWKNYYMNGKVQKTRAQITFEDFDPNKMD